MIRWHQFNRQFKISIVKEVRSFLIILAIFLFFSITGVLTQLYLLEILELSGLEITNLPEPSIENALADVWGDFLFLGSIIVIYLGTTIFSSDISGEKSIYILMSRPISREEYYLSKVLTKILSILLIVLLTSISVYGLGMLFFDPISIVIIIGGSIVLGLALTSLMSIIIMVNTRFESMITAVIGITILVPMIIISVLGGYIDQLVWFSPFALSDIWSDMLYDEDYSNFVWYSVALLIWNVVPLTIGNFLFRTRDL